MIELTHQRLKESLNYNQATGVFTWKSKKRKVVAGSVAGSSRENGYRSIKIDQKPYYEHRLAWFFVHGEWPKEEIDHINGVRGDNRIDNLREASHSQNHQNKTATRANTSGEKGVNWSKRERAWRARVKLNGKEISAGYHADRQDAVNAVRAARERLHGEFCNHGASS